MAQEPPYRPPYSPISCHQVYAPSRLPPPPHETAPNTFPRSTPHYRLNLLVSDGSGDTLYFAYSRSHVARYRIHRCNGIQLEPLPATTIHPPTVVNNVRVAHFAPHRGGDLLLMTGGSELTAENGTLSVMPLPRHSRDSESPYKRARRGRSAKNISSVHAHTFKLPVRSAWGLAVHDETCRIAVSSNSHSVLLLSITTSNAFVNVAGTNTGGISGPVMQGQNATEPGTVGGVTGTLGNVTVGNGGIQNQQLDGAGNHIDDYENRQDGGFERHFRLVPVGDLLYGTHQNNIPCVAFNSTGDRLASASIDTTFAIFDLSESCDPLDMIMDLFVPRVSGRMLFQSSNPLSASRDVNRMVERAWGVHWTRREGLPLLRTAHAEPHIVHRFRMQREHNIWIPPHSSTTEPNNVDLPSAIFWPTNKETAAPSPFNSSRHIVLYDDYIEHDFGAGDPSLALSNYLGTKLSDERADTSSENASVEDLRSKSHLLNEGFAFFPESARRTGWRKRVKKGRDDGYLLVALETTLQLYSVRETPNGRVGGDETGAENDEGEGEGERNCLTKLVDEVHLYWAVQSNGGSTQVMFTNMIEIEKLRAFVLTGVGGGVFIVRIVDVDVEENNKKVDENAEHEPDEEMKREKDLGGPQLFVERVFTTGSNIIGTCVVERNSNCRSLRSFELWILEQNGHIQCWDIECDSQSTLDPSDVL